MKALKTVLLACSLSAVAAMAHAQTTAPAPAADGQQQFAQTQGRSHESSASGAAQHGRLAAPAKKAEDCVGPVSFCNLFFGS